MNDFTKPIMRVIDKFFYWGRIGFGSFDDTGRISTFNLYAPRFRVSKARNPFIKGCPLTINNPSFKIAILHNLATIDPHAYWQITFCV